MDYKEELSKAKSDLHQAEHLQDLMKKANAILRGKGDEQTKIQLLVSAGWKEENAKKILSPDFMGRKGFPQYKLTNNNALIKRLEDKVKKLETNLKGSKSETEERYVFEGGEIFVNYEINRVQILFPGGRTDKETFQKLRRSGFVYSPSNKAFQRQINPIAIRTAVSLFDAKKVDEAELEKGIEVESEHADTISKIASGEISPEQAPEEIAKDHLTEDTKYYDKLEEVEGKKELEKVELPLEVWELIKELNEIDSPNKKAEIWNEKRNLILPKIRNTIWQTALYKNYTEGLKSTGKEERISFSGSDLLRAITNDYKENGFEVADKPLIVDKTLNEPTHKRTLDRVENLSSLDTHWTKFKTYYGDDRYFRKFVFSPEEARSPMFRDFTDRGVKEIMEENPKNGYISVTLSVSNTYQTKELDDLYEEIYQKYGNPGIKTTKEVFEPNTGGEFDEAIFEILDEAKPHGWVGQMMKQRVILKEIYSNLQGPEAEKEKEVERLFKAFYQREISNPEYEGATELVYDSVYPWITPEKGNEPVRQAPIRTEQNPVIETPTTDEDETTELTPLENAVEIQIVKNGTSKTGELNRVGKTAEYIRDFDLDNDTIIKARISEFTPYVKKMASGWVTKDLRKDVPMFKAMEDKVSKKYRDYQNSLEGTPEYYTAHFKKWTDKEFELTKEEIFIRNWYNSSSDVIAHTLSGIKKLSEALENGIIIDKDLFEWANEYVTNAKIEFVPIAEKWELIKTKVSVKKELTEEEKAQRERQKIKDQVYLSMPSINRSVLTSWVSEIEQSLKPLEDEIYTSEVKRYTELAQKYVNKPKVYTSELNKDLKFWYMIITGDYDYELKGYVRNGWLTNLSLKSDWNRIIEKEVKDYVEMLKWKLIGAMLKNFLKVTNPISKIQQISIKVGFKGFEGIYRIFFTNGAKFDFETQGIGAGGYNIQTYHHRYLSNFTNIIKPNGEKGSFWEVAQKSTNDTNQPIETNQNMSDYQKERERQLASGEISPETEGISLYALAKEINKPKVEQPQVVKLKAEEFVAPVSNSNELMNKVYDNQYELNKAIEDFVKMLGPYSDNYTSDQKAFIKKYSGYGGLSKYGPGGKGAFFEYYTPVAVIRKMWALAYKYGYKGGSILEPSVGTGEFLAFAPPNAKITGFEISEHSATICKVLYPEANIVIEPFEKQFIAKNNVTLKDKIEPKYDLVIGNPPYGSFDVVKSRYMNMGEDKFTEAKNYAEYFMRRSMDLLKPNGLLVFIIGASIEGGGTLFLDSGLTPVKEYLAQHCDLLDAYRLPDAVFERTGVTSEIVVLQKKG